MNAMQAFVGLGICAGATLYVPRVNNSESRCFTVVEQGSLPPDILLLGLPIVWQVALVYYLPIASLLRGCSAVSNTQIKLSANWSSTVGPFYSSVVLCTIDRMYRAPHAVTARGLVVAGWRRCHHYCWLPGCLAACLAGWLKSVAC